MPVLHPLLWLLATSQNLIQVPWMLDAAHGTKWPFGSLIFLELGTQPDIPFAVTKLSQMSSNPSEEHVRGIKHVLRYLIGTRKYRLVYDSKLGYRILAFADSNWDSDPFTRRSQSGYILKLANGLINWTSCAQKTVAQSSTEAEYMSLSDCSHQITWVCNLMTEISYPMITATPIYGNKQGSIFIASNPITERRTKHIDIKYHYIHQEIERNHVAPFFVEGVNNTADLFTKNLLLVKFDKFIHELGLEFDK
jgi:hypothetical protein